MCYRSQTSVSTLAKVSKAYSWDEHMAKVIGKGRAYVGKMNAILADWHDTRINLCTLINVIRTKARICRSMERDRELCCNGSVG